MFSPDLSLDSSKEHHILCIGAHCDDIEIGCGGTLLKLAAWLPLARFTWFILTGNEVRQEESKVAQSRFLGKPDRARLVFNTFPDGFLPQHGSEVKHAFEALKEMPRPDLIFTHYRDDLHQDHRLVSGLTWNTFRDHMILEYEIPKFDGDIGNPNTYVLLDSQTARKKCEIIVESFLSQAEKRWFRAETFEALMRLRAVEAASRSEFAEAFYARKIIIEPRQDEALQDNKG